jgi:T4 RnlA family RNA ligase
MPWLGYMEPHLKILNIRSEVSGAYQDLSQELKEYWIKSVETNDPAGFVSLIPGLVDIEGYVIQLVSGQRVKIKCEWYLSLHHAKDSVNNPRRLFEAILDEGIDDLRSLFYADPLAMRTIDEMQVKVDHVYNHMVRMVEDYYNENKHLDRKTYAINGQLHFKDTIYFGLAMNKYSGKAVNYKEFLKGKWREIGLKDTSLDDKDS